MLRSWPARLHAVGGRHHLPLTNLPSCFSSLASFHYWGREMSSYLRSSWPSNIPEGRLSNEIVHEVDTFTTLAKIAGAEIPTDRPIDGVDQTDFFMGKSEKSIVTASRFSWPIASKRLNRETGSSLFMMRNAIGGHHRPSLANRRHSISSLTPRRNTRRPAFATHGPRDEQCKSSPNFSRA
jgi:hypothetical protein